MRGWASVVAGAAVEVKVETRGLYELKGGVGKWT